MSIELNLNDKIISNGLDLFKVVKCLDCGKLQLKKVNHVHAYSPEGRKRVLESYVTKDGYKLVPSDQLWRIQDGDEPAMCACEQEDDEEDEDES